MVVVVAFQVSFEFPISDFQVEPTFGGPFVVSFLHFDETTTTSSNNSQNPQMPASMVGLIASALPPIDSAWTLDKYAKQIKDQLLKKGGKDCKIFEERESLVSGRMKARDIVYLADARTFGQHGQGPALMEKMKCVQRVCLFGNTSFILLFQCFQSAFEQEWALASPVFDSLRFFS